MMNKRATIKAIQSIDPAASFSISIHGINWNSQPISQSEIDAKIDQAKFEVAMEDLRTDRNKKLADSDWRALSDQDMSQEWADYRQSLRDITQDLATVEDVNSVIWPIPPE